MDVVQKNGSKPPQKTKLALIGGSAGSLAPLKTIIHDIGAMSKLAIVVIQHLDPAKKSSLVQLLGRQTEIPVESITDGLALLPGHIYVVTPGDEVSFNAGKARVEPTAGETGAQHLIDRVAASLTTDHSFDPVLVILSGNGSDGLLGAEMFREQGLQVLVQALEEAQFSSMPSAIVDRDLADEVLPAAAMGAHLSDFSLQLDQGRESGEAKLSADDLPLHRVVDTLKNTLDRDFSEYRSGTLSRRLQRRMNMFHCETVDEYLARFANDTAELKHLADDFLIQVTRFFRDPEAFETLRTAGLPDLIDQLEEGDEFRAWVVGCSTGEEVYSLVILLNEYLEKHRPNCSIKVFATDADGAAIDVARAGVYQRDALASVPVALREKYFERRESGYHVRKSIRETVIFATHNVISDTPFSKLHLVLCRNLIIYLNASVKLALLRLFHFTLVEEGLLFLGSSESVGRVERHFKPVSRQWRIYRRSDAAPRRRPQYPLFSNPMELQLVAPEVVEAAPVLAGGHSIMRRVLEESGAAQLLVDELDRLAYTLGPADVYLHVPSGEPTEDFLSLVIPPLQSSVRGLLNLARQEGSALKSGIWCSETNGSGYFVSLAASLVDADGFEGYVTVSINRNASTLAHKNTEDEVADEWVIDMLRQEVDATREDMQQTIRHSRASDDVLRQANEHIMAMNEEFQSANEELEASKEEMQSLNDELASTNAQLEKRMGDLQALNSDLENVFRSSDSATLIVDGRLCIKRFTPNITTLMRLRVSDHGREVEDITRLFDDPMFEHDIREAIGTERTVEANVRTSNGRSFLRRILPYIDAKSRVSGAVINFIDVSEFQATLARDRESARMLRWQSQLLDMAAPIFGRGMDGTISFWNRSAEALWGYSSEAALGQQAHELLKTGFPSALENAQRALVAEGHWRGVVAQTTRDGRRIDLAVSWTMTVVNDAGDVAVSEVYQDLSVTMRLRSALREEQELFHLLLDWTMNAEYWTDEKGIITYMTPAVEDITGYAAQAFIEDPRLLGTIIEDSAREDWERHMSPAQSPGPNHWKSIALPIRRRDGDTAWVEHRYRIIYSGDTSILGYRGTIRDIDEVHRLEGEAQRLAYSDPLTDLPNRRSLAARLEDACMAGSRTREYCALVMLDLDQFKLVNDTDGHPVGDLLLVEVAERLRARLRAFDTVARVGGDEFMLILNNLGMDPEEASLSANRICENIRRDIARAYDLKSAATHHTISASFGLVLFVGNEKSADTLMRQADMALYNAKDQGRNRVMLFDPDMQASVAKRLQTEHDLAAALAEDRLALRYQAQTDSEGELRGIEALLRCINESGDEVIPSEFMGALEVQPLVTEVGKWTLEQAIRQRAHWNERGAALGVPVAVNVSAGYLASNGFYEDVTQALKASAVDAGHIVLEITENSLLKDLDHCEELLRHLTDMGIGVSLDDFGTGFSSLSHLKSLPIGQLKIDRSFVMELPEDTSCHALVESTIAIGQALNLTVVAEGVETGRQLDTLMELGCEIFQGYLFSKPASAEDFEAEFLELQS